MFAAIALITVGGIMVYSALKGIGLTDVVAGVTGEPLDPKGGNTNPVQSTTPAPNGSAQGVPGASGALGTPPIGGLSGSAIEQEMNRMISLNQPYKWGGGHQGFSQNGPWDCSGAVSWLMHYIGIPLKGPLISTAFMSQGKPGRGQVFTIYANPTHVFLIMESGAHAGKAWGTTRRVGKTGSVQWHDHATAGFTPRHYEGW